MTRRDPSLAEKIRALIEEQAPETQTRGIVFHTDFDSRPVFVTQASRVGEQEDSEQDEREKALRALIRFVIATVPDGCEVYWSIARPGAPVALLEAAELTLRWQVAGDRRGGAEAAVVPLRPRLGNAQAQIVGKRAQALRADFRSAGWGLTLEAIQGGQELWVRAEIS